MADITLETLWLNAAADLSDAMSFPTMNGLRAQLNTPGAIRTYANGRTRLITQAGRPRSSKASLPHLTRAQVEWLEDHAGQLVLVRDAQGRKFFGAYFSPDFDERGFVDEAGTDLVFAEVTHSEAV